jgi:uncharacterized OB-fold protein
MSETGPEGVERAEEDRDDDEPLSYSEWADALREDVLLGQACSDCGHVTAAPKAACAQCGSRDVSATELDTEGEVYSVTTIGVPPARFEGEYEIALIDFGAGRVLARIGGSVEIGDRVTFAEAMEAEGRPTPVFEPIEES